MAYNYVFSPRQQQMFLHWKLPDWPAYNVMTTTYACDIEYYFPHEWNYPCQEFLEEIENRLFCPGWLVSWDTKDQYFKYTGFDPKSPGIDIKCGELDTKDSFPNVRTLEVIILVGDGKGGPRQSAQRSGKGDYKNNKQSEDHDDSKEQQKRGTASCHTISNAWPQQSHRKEDGDRGDMTPRSSKKDKGASKGHGKKEKGKTSSKTYQKA